MQAIDFLNSQKKLRLVFRSLAYSSIVAAIFFMLIYCREQNLLSTFTLLAQVGLLLVIIESFFTIFYLNQHPDRPKKIGNYKFRHHALNHLLYPFVYYFALVSYIAFEENILLSSMLGFMGFIMYYLHFYYLPRHIHFDHIDHPESKKVSAKIDFIMYLFKFLSYFVVNLSLFQAVAQSKISFNVVFIVNFALMWLYFFFHLNRKEKVSTINVLMAGIFSFISALVIIYSKTSITNFSAAVATLIFYLSSGIYYHKVDGTLDYRVLIEYSSIATILSIFLFSV